MKKYSPLFITFGLIAALAIGVAALASDVTGAKYSGTVRVSNNGTAASSVSANCNINTDILINFGYMNDATDAVIRSQSGGDIAFAPSVNSSYPWMIYVPSIGANGNLDYSLYTGNVTGGKLRYFPGPAGMNAGDPAALELSDNFSIEISGYVDTTATGANITSKENAARLYIKNTSEIAASLYSDNVTPPTGTLDPSTGWTNDANAIDDNIATFAQTSVNIAPAAWSPYLVGSFTEQYTGGVSIYADVAVSTGESVDLDIYDTDISAWADVYQGVFDDNSWATYYIETPVSANAVRVRLYNSHGNPQLGYVYELQFVEAPTITATGVSSGEHDIDVTTAPVNDWESPTGFTAASGWADEAKSYDGTTVSTAISPAIPWNNWCAYLELTHAGLQMNKARYYITADYPARIDQVDFDAYYGGAWNDVFLGAPTFSTWFTVNMTAFRTVTAVRFRAHENLGAGTTSIYLREVELGQVGDKLSISLDGVEQAAAYDDAITVPDNANDIIIAQAAAMPYMESANITIGGALTASWAWQYAETWPDSVSSIVATPSFRTTSSDPDVSASLLDFRPTSEAQAVAANISYAGVLVEDVPDMPSTMYTDNATPGIFFAPVVNVLLDAGQIPRTLFWYPFAYFWIIFFGAVTFRITQKLLLQAVIMWAVMLIFCLPGLNVLGMWTLIFFSFEVFAVMVLDKNLSW